jgi:hypothetical protein
LKEINYNPSHFEWIRISKTNKDWNESSLKVLRQCKTLGMCINYNGPQDDPIIRKTLNLAEMLDESKESPEHSTYVQVRPALKILGNRTSVEVPKIQHPLLKITDYKFFGAGEERDYNKCEAYHFAPFIWQDGDVDVCGYHRKDAKFNLGNLYSTGERGRFRHIMKNTPDAIDIISSCQICCKLNAMNSLIYNMRRLQDKDFP